MATNRAAWISESKANPLKVAEAAMPKPGPKEVVVKNGAVAINPVDWKIQEYGLFLETYPYILGTDISGEIVDVGSEVTSFKKGDRVLAHCIGLATKKPEDNAFQSYTRVPAITTSLLPSSASFTEGAVLPLAISTATAGLYQEDALALPYPTTSPEDSGKVLLVWGGASSVGSTAVQLAVASGVVVITTASKHNHSYCKNIGASAVIDYNSPSVVDDIVKAIKDTGKQFAGVYDSISLTESFKPCFDILQKVEGGSKKMATVLPPTDVPDGLEVKGVFAVTPALAFPAVGEAVWGKFVPEALKSGALKFLPEPLVVGKGLESIQKGFDKQKEGVSARKVVVEL
ncbi:hypothetical protein AAFC00_005773 [Neodothiora populina]|uniref:Enoyl reductase (ER) domain-containing protein n=1 Tax=Neodothiora populina TaxID=2781224 RepID=A0ABR3P5T0_9PEZI